MAKKSLQKVLARCLTFVLCMGLFCMQAVAAEADEETIVDAVILDENGLPLVDIPDEPIPVTELPAGLPGGEAPGTGELSGAAVPLAVVPQTGDASALGPALSGAFLLGLLLTGKARGKEE